MFIIVTILSVLLFAVTSFRPRGAFLLNPMVYYFFFQTISFVGTVSILDEESTVDQAYFWIFVTAMLSSSLGIMVGNYVVPLHRILATWNATPYIVETGRAYKEAIYALAITSAMVCALYFYVIGYNVFLLGVSNLWSSGTALAGASELRLATYNSAVNGQYFAPGYVNQFKDTLFPLAIIYLWSLVLVEPKRSGRFLQIVLLLALSVGCCISILGTGQRGAFAIVLAIGIGYFALIIPRRQFKSIFAVIVVLGLFLFAVSTQINGRAQVEFEIASVLQSIWSRIIYENQIGAVLGFRLYIHDAPIQWGAEWADSVLGILPSHPGSSLANDIAQLIWGGFGTVPPSNWGSVFYNFGWSGVVFFPFLMCASFPLLQMRYYSGRKSLFRTLLYVSSYVLIGSWICGGPFEYLLNVGLVAILILRYICWLLELSFGLESFVAKQVV